MASNMVDFPSVLSLSARPIIVRFIDQDFDAATCATAFLSTFFLDNGKSALEPTKIDKKSPFMNICIFRIYLPFGNIYMLRSCTLDLKQLYVLYGILSEIAIK